MSDIIVRENIRYDLKKITRQELLSLRIMLENDINSIRFQLDGRKNQSEEWARRARASMKIKGSQVQQVQAELSKRKERVRFLNAFYDVAAKGLPSDVFDGLRNLAREFLDDEDK